LKCTIVGPVGIAAKISPGQQRGVVVERTRVRQPHPAALADLAKRRLRLKIPALTETLSGRFSDHHAFLARIHLDLIDQHTRACCSYDQEKFRIGGPC
jgi:hypothetical protein